MPRRAPLVLLTLAVCLGPVRSALAQDQSLEDRLRNLEETLKKQEETIKEQQKLINGLKAEVARKKATEKQVAAQPGQTQPPAGVQAGKPATLAVGEAPLPQAEEAKAAPAAAAESTQTAALQEEVQELKEQVSQVADAQKQEFLRAQSRHRVCG